jgi:hypothetical protein
MPVLADDEDYMESMLVACGRKAGVTSGDALAWIRRPKPFA